jgi:hypothetical protein
MTLSEKIAAGLATDAEVAEALGFYQAYPHDAPMNGWKWHTPDGRWLPKLPPLQTCFTTLTKECERRGWAFMLDYNPSDTIVWGCSVDDPQAYKGSGTAPTPALALCAALVAAVMEKNDDSR